MCRERDTDIYIVNVWHRERKREYAQEKQWQDQYSVNIARQTFKVRVDVKLQLV